MPKAKKAVMSHEHIFEIHYSPDGIEDQRAFIKGTWVDAIFYRAELIMRGNTNITIEQKEDK